MAKLDSNTLFGALLVLLGAFLLAQTMGLVATVPHVTWSIVFLVSGLAFLALMLRGRGEWWPLIPGFTLLAVGILVGLDAFAPGVSPRWGGALFLGMIGAAFAGVYISNRRNWWAIIPGGTLMTLATVALVDQGGRRGGDGGLVFLAGLGLTFLAVYFAPNPRGRMTWALFPAGILLALSFVAGLRANNVLDTFWPVALIAVGTYLVYQALTTRRAHQ